VAKQTTLPAPASQPDSALLAEYYRLQDENEFLKKDNKRLTESEENMSRTAACFEESYNDCRAHAARLEAKVSALELRPPVDAPFWRRVKYLFTRR